ncbi:peptidase S8/S53 domain-containing protein [Hypomontagnella monticulosa]|nr:peptidase S8/S53 domain-containing protein [Hypomontagnella monticulosa]
MDNYLLSAPGSSGSPEKADPPPNKTDNSNNNNNNNSSDEAKPPDSQPRNAHSLEKANPSSLVDSQPVNQAQPSESGATASLDSRDGTDVFYQYNVLPNDPQDKNTNSAAYSGILAIVTDPASIRTQESPYIGIIYWYVKLTADQAKLVYQIPGVAAVHRDCDDDCYDPSIELVRQPDSSDDMVMIGQFGAFDEQNNLRKQEFDWYQHNYVYDESGGRGVDVYIVDTGANLDNAEFTNPPDDNIKTRARFIHAQPDETDENDSALHGTCMLSRLAGHKYGVAKSVNPIIVRVPSPPKVGYYMNAVQKVVDDIGDGNKQAVLSMSWFYPRTDALGRFILHDDNGGDISEKYRVLLRVMLRFLVSKGVTPVTGSGNDERTTIDGFPADFGDPNSGVNYIPELIVVGGTSADGTIPYNKGNVDIAKGLPHVYAPAVMVQCAHGQQQGYRTLSGTSQATASVAGLAAYFIGLGNQRPLPEIDVSTPALLKDHIIKLAWPRGNNQNMMSFYNGARPADAGVDGPSCKVVLKRTAKESELPDEEDCGCPAGQKEVPDGGDLSGTPTTMQTSTIPNATTAPTARKWTCTPG